MKKLIALLPLIALLACQNPGGTDNPLPGPTPGKPSHINIVGAKALFLNPTSAGQSVRSLASMTVTGGGALRQLLTDNTTAPAAFTDGQGLTVDVTITRTLQLDADYLLIDYTSVEASGIAVVALATGVMTDLTATPDNWDHIRVKAGLAYYVSGGALQKCTLPATIQDISQGDRISANSLLFLDSGNNVHTLYLVNGSIDPTNQIRIYPADGSAVNMLGWGSPDAYMVYEGYGARYLEDEATGNLYAVDGFASFGFGYQLVTMDATGVYHGVAKHIDAGYMPSSHVSQPTGKAFLGNVAYKDTLGKVATLTISEGAITGATEHTLSFVPTASRYSNGIFYGESGSGIHSLNMSTGSESSIITASGITDFEVLGDQVFYATAAGVFQYDTVSATTATYAGPIVEPVVE